MTDSTNDNVSAVSSPLSLSDEEIAGMSFEQLMEKYGDSSSDDSNDDDNDTSEEATEEEEEESTEEVEEEESEETEEEETEESEETEETEETKKEKDTELDSTEKDDQTKQYEELQSIKDKLFAPFKANGKELQVDTVEQAISLMQMGANYTQKMTQIKPQLKTLQMLEQHGLTDPTQLSYLIDLHKKDPKAIAKLIKDADLSPHQLGDEEADAYTSSDYLPTDTQFDFATVTKDLRASTGVKYTELMNHVQAFDAKSKNELFENPLILKDLSEHVIDGTFDKVMAEVDRRRILGDKTVANLPTLQAYVTVGQQMADAASKAPPAVKDKVIAKKAVIPKAKVNEAKAKASAVKSSGGGKQQEVDFLSMSDEEFLAFDKSSKLLR